MPTIYQLAHKRCWLEAYGKEHPIPNFIPAQKMIDHRRKRVIIRLRGKFKPRTAHEKRLWKKETSLEEEDYVA